MADIEITVDSSQLQDLQRRIDKLKVSSSILEGEFDQLTSGILNSNKEFFKYSERVEQVIADQNRFAEAIRLSNQSQNQMQRAMQESQAGARQSELFIQQLGYQVGDFAVQVQSGTSALVAFAQQGTQILGFLPNAGAMGAVAGAVLAVSTAVLNLGLNMMSAKSSTDQAKDSIDNFKSSFDTLTSSQDAVAKAQERYTQAIYLSGVAQANVTPEIVQGLALEADARERLLRVEQTRFELRKFELEQAIKQQKEVVAGLLEEVNLLNNPDAASSEFTRTRAESERLERVKQIVAANKEVFLTLAESQAELDLINSLLSGTGEEFDDILASAKELGITIPGIDFSKALSSAAQLAEQLGISVSHASQLMAIGGGQRQEVVFDPRDPNYDPIAAEMARMQGSYSRTSPFDPSRQPKTATSRGIAGGNSRLDSLINQLQTEREVLDEWYTQSQETLMAASESELQIIGGYNEAKLRLAEEYQQRLKAINEDGKASQLETVLSGSAQILGAMGAFSDKALRISKAFAAAEALVSTYKGAAKELEKGVIGFGTAAALIARGLAFVAAIKGVSSSGNAPSVSGGGSTRGSATVAPTTAAAPTPQTVFIDSIDPKSLYSGETLINLFEAFYNENDKRGKVFVVAR